MFLLASSLVLPFVARPLDQRAVDLLRRMGSIEFPQEYQAQILSHPDTQDALEILLRDPRCRPAFVSRALFLISRMPAPPNRYRRPTLYRLTDTNDVVRSRALQLLVQIGSPTDIVAIIPLLSDEGPSSRYGSAKTLSAIGDHRTVAVFDVWLAGISWEAYGTLYRKHVVEHRDLLIKSLARDRIPHVSSPADDAVRQMTNADKAVRLAAVRRLAEIGTRAERGRRSWRA